jgi:hypothetical protein
MKKTVTATLLLSSLAWSGFAESALSGEYGTISGRVRYLSMVRDYENRTPAESVYGHSLGLQLGYYSPEIHGFDLGVTYNFAGSLDASDDSDHGGDLISNGNFSILNEAYARYRFSEVGLTNSTVWAGRKIMNSEIFTRSDSRQKCRSVEGVAFESSDLPSTRLLVGHALRMSNIYGRTDIWDFNDFGDVLKAGYDTDGVTLGELVYTGVPKAEVAVYNGYAWDICNLAGTRGKFTLQENTHLLTYYRNESSVGRASGQNSDAFGLSLQQKAGRVQLEGGGFSVHGDNLRFMATSTGFNHALASALIIYTNPCNGGADTAYFKATTKVGKVSLYGLYMYTWHDRQVYDAQELNLIAKYPLTDSVLLQFKGGVGYRDTTDGSDNTTATDFRFFLTYSF